MLGQYSENRSQNVNNVSNRKGLGGSGWSGSSCKQTGSPERETHYAREFRNRSFEVRLQFAIQIVNLIS